MKEHYINFDEMFFGVAMLAGLRSKDPNTQNGACIVSDNRPIGVGYNGLTDGVEDTPEIWTSPEKYKWVYHAERNAIANSDLSKLRGSSLYLWSSRRYLPCTDCAMAITKFGICNIFIMGMPKESDTYDWGQTQKLFTAAGVSIVEITMNEDGILERIKECLK